MDLIDRNNSSNANSNAGKIGQRLRVLVVEDEQEIGEIIKKLLEAESYEIRLLDSANDLVAQVADFHPELILLDQILPGKSGTDALQELRSSEYSLVPVIMVTGLSGEDERVGALNLGADDYVTKPFYPRELTARIKALLRRLNREPKNSLTSTSEVADSKFSILDSEGIRIDFKAHRVWSNQQEVFLTLTEFRILVALVKEKDQVLSREILRERALGNLNVTDRTIDVHMASLRKKMGNLGIRIETVRGIGYRFS